MCPLYTLFKILSSIKYKIKIILDHIIPVTIIKSANKQAKIPSYLTPIFSLYTKKHIIIFNKKVKNLYDK